MKTEAELIDFICGRIPSRSVRSGPWSLTVGVGDDAAVLSLTFGEARRVNLVWSCDTFLEDVHFLAHVHPPESVGYKALTRATSDLVAMGAAPRYFLLSLALPSDRTGRWLERFLRGMARAARRYGLVLAGGDTARHPSVAIDISVLGEVEAGRAVGRSGARPGHLLYVTGRLGAAQLGLELVLRGLHRQRRWEPLLRRHLYPELRLALGQQLAHRRLATAMIDTSDGFSTDLEHLCQASHVGARVWADRIPVVRVPLALGEQGLEGLKLALHGGEDYELLFTIARRSSKLIARISRGLPITLIGEIVRGKGILLLQPNGRSTCLEARGWNHFRSR